MEEEPFQLSDINDLMARMRREFKEALSKDLYAPEPDYSTLYLGEKEIKELGLWACSGKISMGAALLEESFEIKVIAVDLPSYYDFKKP